MSYAGNLQWTWLSLSLGGDAVISPFPALERKVPLFFFPSETGNFVLVRLVGRLAGLSNTPRCAEFSGTPSNQTRP